ncbi:MAG: four helix bundle protein [Kiritimatiellales bacterium]|nr:four helix bundle protein [Kiritimatiellales bacterium]
MVDQTRKYTKGFRNLIVWKESHELTKQIYKITRQFPADERFGITSQLRRASSSIGANIAEGSSRKTSKDQKNFYNIAKASLSEVDNFLELAHDLGYLPDQDYNSLLELINKVAYLLCRLINQ